MMSLFLVNLQSLTQEAVKRFELSLDKTDQSDCVLCFTADFTLNKLRGSLPKSGPLDFATENTFPLFFVGEEALAGIY